MTTLFGTLPHDAGLYRAFKFLLFLRILFVGLTLHLAFSPSPGKRFLFFLFVLFLLPSLPPSLLSSFSSLPHSSAWDGLSGKMLWAKGGHEDGVVALDVSLDGSRILTGSDDKTVKLYDATLPVEK